MATNRIIRPGAKELGEKQMDLWHRQGVHKSEFVSFEHEGMCITNPWIDEGGFFAVDPIEYYGQAFIDSEFCMDVTVGVTSTPWTPEED